MPQQVQSTYTKAIAISPSDSANLPQFDNRYPDAIYVGTAGIAQVVFGDSAVVAFDAPQGVLPLRGAVRINNTDTTAAELVGLWQA